MSERRDHQHHHHHRHDDDFDWEAMADALELDAAMIMPLVHDVLGTLDTSSITHVLDVGCGPGTAAIALAEALPSARITALDSSVPLLARVRHRAAELGLDDRVWTIAADLESPLPQLPTAELVWASMVLHHVSDPGATLQQLHAQLAPGGLLVMVEFGNVPSLLPTDHPAVAGGSWDRLQAAVTAARNARLGLDPVLVDWPPILRDAGFTDVTDTHLVADHPEPLHGTGRRWLVQHLRRGIEFAGDQLSADDVAVLEQLADEAPTRDGLAVRAERRILTARRPATG